MGSIEINTCVETGFFLESFNILEDDHNNKKNLRRTHFPYFINSKPTVGIQRMAWTLLTFYSLRSRRFCWVIVQFYAQSLLVLKLFPHPTEKVFPYGATHQLYKWALGTCPIFFQCRNNRLVK